MIPAYFLVAAIAVRLAGEARYVAAVVRGQARPNPVSWICWSLAPLVAFAAQLSDGLRTAEWMTLVLSVGPLAVVTVVVVKGGYRSRVSRLDLACGVTAGAGLAGWLLTSQPATALVLCIAADLIATVPTVHNAYRHPHDECAPTYLMSSVAMAVTLLTVDGWSVDQVILPLYILAVNAALYAVIRLRTTAAAPILSTVDGVLA